MKEDKRKRKFKKVYKNNKIYVKVARNAIYFIVAVAYLLKETLIKIEEGYNPLTEIVFILNKHKPLFIRKSQFRVFIILNLTNHTKPLSCYVISPIGVCICR